MSRLWLPGRHPHHANPSGWELARTLATHLGHNAGVTDHFGGGYYIETTAPVNELEAAASLYLDNLGITWEAR